MAVEAVVFVVIQKVRDLLIQESIIFDKVVDQVEDIRLHLRRMRVLTDAEEQPETDEATKEWVKDYLNTLYNVEDIVESYVLRLVRKKTKFCLFQNHGFYLHDLLQNYGFYLHDLTACQKFRRKMKQIEEEIERLNKGKPEGAKDASLRGILLGQEQTQLSQEEITSDMNTGSFSNTKGVLSRYDSEDIAMDGDGKPFCIRELNESESWDLFQKSLGSSQLSAPSSLKNQILEICKGLPLINIVLLGGFLSTKKMGEWAQVLSQSNWASSNLWYADLPADHKLCLLYLTLFPKEFDLSVRRILRLWVAEGFLQRPTGLGEDLAAECFSNLVRRNLIKISKFRSDGGHRKCHLPGFLYKHLSPKAQEISLFHIHQQSPAPPRKTPDKTLANRSSLSESGIRRIVEYADIKDFTSDTNFQNLRSYFSFNVQRYDTPAKGVENLRKIIGDKGFGLLRVLDLEGVYKPILPTTMKHLFQLRYLGLRWTFLDSLPESVGDLPYLETLDLKRTHINTLSSSIWKLKHLRHLNLPQVRLDMTMHQPSSQLLTLWGLTIDDGCNMETGLKQLGELRELGITCQLKQFDTLLIWIASLTHLQSLSLTSKDENGCPSNLSLGPSSELDRCPSNLSLEPLSELHKLSRLKLLGKLSHRLNKDQFPPNLRVLTLSVSHLNEDPIQILSQLQTLSVLRLLAKSYLGQEMSCPRGGFSSLRVLKLWMLDELEEFRVEQGGMPNIRELHIRRCLKLKALHNLLQQSTLEELILTSMPKEFEENVRKNKSEHTNLQTNSYEFTPLPVSLRYI